MKIPCFPKRPTENRLPSVEEDMSRQSRFVSIYPYKDLVPKIADNVFLADGVRIVGDVEIGRDASIWYNTVIRGDVHHIRIGDRTNIQDNCLLHVTHDTAPLLIGQGVTVGHQATLHSCTIQDYCLVGMGAIVLDNAVVEEYAFVAAGAVVRPGFIVPSKTLVAGVPAQVIRDLHPEEIADLPASADRYFEYATLSWEGITKGR